MPQRDFDADKAAQEVMNAWGTNIYAGNGKHLSADFKALFDRTCAYRIAKNVADNRREQGVLTEPDVARAQKAKNEFVDAYRACYETRESDDVPLTVRKALKAERNRPGAAARKRKHE